MSVFDQGENMKRIARAVLAAFFAALSCTAFADPISYTFQVTATDGPLAGTVANGTFSFDDSVIPPGGGTVNQTALLTDLDFAWNGIAYTEATANTGYLAFDALGGLNGFCFGTNVVAGVCTVFAGVEEWFVSSGFFAYSVPDANSVYFGTVSFRQLTVPEPGTALLILAGLVGLVAQRTRVSRRAKVA